MTDILAVLPLEIILIILNHLRPKDITRFMLTSRELWFSHCLREYCKKFVVNLGMYPDDVATLFNVDIHVSIPKFVNLMNDCAKGRADSLTSKPERIYTLRVSHFSYSENTLSNPKIDAKDSRLRDFFNRTYKFKKLILSDVALLSDNFGNFFKVVFEMMYNVECLLLISCYMGSVQLPPNLKNLCLSATRGARLGSLRHLTKLSIINSDVDINEILSLKDLNELNIENVYLPHDKIRSLLSVPNIHGIKCSLHNRRRPSIKFHSCTVGNPVNFMLQKKEEKLILTLMCMKDDEDFCHSEMITGEEMFSADYRRTVLMVYRGETREDVRLNYARFILSEIVSYLGVPDTRIEIS